MHAVSLRDCLPEDADYTIGEEEHFRLWRAQEAASLLAAVNHDVAITAGITHDGAAAVADYIREELMDVLTSAQRLREPPPLTSPPRGADLI